MKTILIVIIILFVIIVILFNLLLFGLMKCAKKKSPEIPMKERICDCFNENYEL